MDEKKHKENELKVSTHNGGGSAGVITHGLEETFEHLKQVFAQQMSRGNTRCTINMFWK